MSPTPPPDVPEGTTQVLMSTTFFLSLVRLMEDAEVIDWGKPEQWNGPYGQWADVYTPTLRDRVTDEHFKGNGA